MISHFFFKFFQIISCFFVFFCLFLSFSLADSGEQESIIPVQKDTTITIREPFPGQSAEIDVSVQTGSINILSNYISSIFRFVAALSVIIAILVVIGAGFKIMTAGGDTGARTEAAGWIQKTFIGLAFLFLAGLFLKTINPNFYVFGGGNQSDANFVEQNSKTPSETNPTAVNN